MTKEYTLKHPVKYVVHVYTEDNLDSLIELLHESDEWPIYLEKTSRIEFDYTDGDYNQHLDIGDYLVCTVHKFSTFCTTHCTAYTPEEFNYRFVEITK